MALYMAVCMAVCDCIWLYIWLYMIVYGCIWLYMAEYMAIHMAIYGCIYGCIYMAAYGCTWPRKHPASRIAQREKPIHVLLKLINNIRIYMNIRRTLIQRLIDDTQVHNSYNSIQDIIDKIQKRYET